MQILHKARVPMQEFSPTGEISWYYSPSENIVTKFDSEDDSICVEWSPKEILVEACNYLDISPLQLESAEVYSANPAYTEHLDNDTSILYVKYLSKRPALYSLFWQWLVLFLFNIDNVFPNIEVSCEKAPLQYTPESGEKTLADQIKEAVAEKQMTEEVEVILDFDHVVNHSFSD